MGGAGRGGRGGVHGGAYGAMMGCAGGLGSIAMNPGLAAQLSTPAGQREYLNSQLQQVLVGTSLRALVITCSKWGCAGLSASGSAHACSVAPCTKALQSAGAVAATAQSA